MSETTTLITGADGYLGTRLVARLLEESDGPLVLWVRAQDAGERRRKQARLEALFGPEGTRWRLAAGDLRQPQPFAQVDADRVGTIVHAAGLIRFDATHADAQAVNAAGTARALELARCCPRLEAFALLGSLYATGLVAGRVEEAPVEPLEFANEYERSKWIGEGLALGSGLPAHVFRIATVVADDDSGRVGQYNFAHKTLELLYRGLTSVFPGRPECTAYLVTAELVTQAVCQVLRSGAEPGVWHVAPTQAQALSLERLLAVVLDAFAGDEAYRRRRCAPPRFLDEAGFDSLSEAMSTFGRGTAGDAFRALRPFARQMYVSKDVRHDRLAAALGARLRFPDPSELLRRVCQRLLASRWTEATHLAAGPAGVR